MTIDFKKLPRKATGFVFTSLLVFTAGLVIRADKITSIVAALTGLYASFIAGHVYADQDHKKTEEAK